MFSAEHVPLSEMFLDVYIYMYDLSVSLSSLWNVITLRAKTCPLTVLSLAHEAIVGKKKINVSQ